LQFGCRSLPTELFSCPNKLSLRAFNTYNRESNERDESSSCRVPILSNLATKYLCTPATSTQKRKRFE
ncbi:17843_t:CDS:2, partial [Entrophospora sp. SA101]